jgi:hypothetical protein
MLLIGRKEQPAGGGGGTAQASDSDSQSGALRGKLRPGWAIERMMPAHLSSVVGKPVAFKWDPPVGWDATGVAVIFHKNGEFRDTLEIHWKDGSETCLAMSGELRPSAYGEHGGWVVLIPPAGFDAKKQPKATSDQQQRLPLLPKAWDTIDPSKLLLTVPMQNLAEIATEVDLYRPFTRPCRCWNQGGRL